MEKGILRAKKYGNKCLLICFILAMLFLCSCSARKVNKSKTDLKENTLIENSKIDNSKSTVFTDSNTKIIDNGSAEEIEILPVDNSKEMVVNGKTYFNVHLKHKKTLNNKVIEQNKKVSQIKENDIKTANKVNKTKSQVVEMKKSERKSYLSLLWLLLLIPIYFVWRKYKSYLF